MKMCGIEWRSAYYGSEYRWYSKYNGARGPWCTSRKDAERGGDEHEQVIRMLFSCGSEQADTQPANHESVRVADECGRFSHWESQKARTCETDRR